MLATSALLASMLVASSLAHLCNYHPGYTTQLTHGEIRNDVLREGQERTYCIDATRDPRRPRVSNMYIKLATCRGSVSVKLFNPYGQEIVMSGRDCKLEDNDKPIKYHPNSAQDSSIIYEEEHTIWTYHNVSALPGTWTIVVKAKRVPCKNASYQLLASSKEHRQPPVLPNDTCIRHDQRFTTSTQVGLKWLPAKLPSDSNYQIIKYCVYLIPDQAHTHQCSLHGSRCSVAKLRGKDTVEMCFTASKKHRKNIFSIIRGLKPDTKYHVDVIAWTYDRDRQVHNLPMAYSQSQTITTLPQLI